MTGGRIETFEQPGFVPFGGQAHTDYYFRVKAANNEVLAQSEAYTSKAAREKGIRALRRAMLPATRQTEQYAESWQRGYLFAYYQDHGWTAKAAEQKSQTEPPAWLQLIVDKLNPYKRGDA